MSLVDLREVVKHHGARSTGVTALHGVNARIQPGDFCAIVGPSGSGKSTLLSLIGLLDRPTQGRILIAGRDVSELTSTEAAMLRNHKIGLIFQGFHLLPRLSAWQNVALPLLYQRCELSDRRQRACDALERVGLGDRLEHRPGALSGGQRQRVAIARALVVRPELILADEPTGSLDSATAEEIMALLEELNRASGVTVIMVTHDRALAARCRRRIEMLDGRIVLDSAQ